jgi:uncharacterized protein DUF1629
MFRGKDSADPNQKRLDMMANPAAPKRGRQSKARKFYRMGPDLRSGGAAGCKLENERLLLQGQLALGPPAGRRGFPDYPESPRFLFDSKIGRPPRDIEQYSYFWLISDRMKTVLEIVDQEAFAFARCEVRLSNGAPGPAYWLCDVLRILDAVDEAASQVRIEYLPPNSTKFYNLTGGANLVFREDVVGSAHAFRLADLDLVVFCDQQIRDACKAVGLKGVRFRDAANC